MTLHALLAQVGIHRPADLAKCLGLTRQYAHRLWTGQQPISRKMARRIAAQTGLDANALLIADAQKPLDTPKGRPMSQRPPRGDTGSPR
jgi:plasmid maintenance system antidote protein VapI